MSFWTSVFPGAHLVTQLVDHVKYGLGAMLGQGECCPQAAKLCWLDAGKDWQVVCWS